MAIELRLPRYVVLDAGCGEGYFLRRLREALAARLPPQYVLCTGVDISKAAAEQAARQSRDLQVAVASTFHLPVPSGAIGLVLQIMAPGDLGEICRVLRPQGYFLRVTPGPRHLLGLKRLVYPETVLNGPDDQTLSGFQLVAEEFLQHELRLQSSEDISHLLAMTPYYWHVDQSAKDRVAVCKELVTPVEFCVRLYQRNRAGTAKPS
jgi:23S rRNA (guanine745-N1)-methyltransferase